MLPWSAARPDLFGALASHAGDALYELCYLAEFGKAVRYLRGYGGDINQWWADFRSRTAFIKPVDESLLLMLGVSACFSAREDGTPELPFDPRTGVLRPEVWQRWLDWDPHPFGQYGWLEDLLDLPITSALADLLESGARS